MLFPTKMVQTESKPKKGAQVRTGSPGVRSRLTRAAPHRISTGELVPSVGHLELRHPLQKAQRELPRCRADDAVQDHRVGLHLRSEDS